MIWNYLGPRANWDHSTYNIWLEASSTKFCFCDKQLSGCICSVTHLQLSSQRHLAAQLSTTVSHCQRDYNISIRCYQCGTASGIVPNGHFLTQKTCLFGRRLVTKTVTKVMTVTNKIVVANYYRQFNQCFRSQLHGIFITIHSRRSDISFMLNHHLRYILLTTASMSLRLFAGPMLH